MLRDRNEEEVRGYRDGLRLIHEQAKTLPVSEETIHQFHRLTRGEIWDAGRYKEQDREIRRRASARAVSARSGRPDRERHA